MSAEGWRQEHFLIALLSSLEQDFDSRLSYFVAAADAGGGASRNRRRLAAGRELLIEGRGRRSGRSLLKSA